MYCYSNEACEIPSHVRCVVYLTTTYSHTVTLINCYFIFMIGVQDFAEIYFQRFLIVNHHDASWIFNYHWLYVIIACP